MAQKSDKSSAFTPVMTVLVLLLAAAGGSAWFKSTAGTAGGGDQATPAALSQSIPLLASRAVAGEPGALDALRGELERLDEVRSGGASLPGSEAHWAALERHGNAVAGQLGARRALGEAQARVGEALPDLVEVSAALATVSGAGEALAGLERRARAIGETIGSLLAGGADAEAARESLTADLESMQQVRTALGGGDSPLDIAPLPEARRGELLAPLDDALAEVEAAVTAASGAAANAAAAGGDVAALGTAADNLRAVFAERAAGTGGGLLAHPWLVPGLLTAALLAAAVLALLHRRSAAYERAASVHAVQNERNQQAILRLLDELGSLADGDLTVEATVTEDITGAIADSINYAIEKLRELVATINETAIMVDSAAKQTKNTAVHMARAADHQGREIRAATGSIDSMAASIEEVSGNAERSSDVARHSVDVAHKGGEAVRRTIDGMNTIRETIQETSKRIKRLGESSQEIGNIVELINDIAEQTNILALNASIQASMAGEAGRGFAVVADEVQRLAERSTNATKQIEVLVRTIQSDTNEAVISMERSTTDVVGGALLAENAGAALDEIEQVSNQIASLVQNISGSAREQAGSAADVTRRTAKLKEISEQTGKATAATAAAISKLSVLASQLRETVAGFTLPSSAVKPGALSKPAPDKATKRIETQEKEAAG